MRRNEARREHLDGGFPDESISTSFSTLANPLPVVAPRGPRSHRRPRGSASFRVEGNNKRGEVRRNAVECTSVQADPHSLMGSRNVVEGGRASREAGGNVVAADRRVGQGGRDGRGARRWWTRCWQGLEKMWDVELSWTAYPATPCFSAALDPPFARKHPSPPTLLTILYPRYIHGISTVHPRYIRAIAWIAGDPGAPSRGTNYREFHPSLQRYWSATLPENLGGKSN